MKELLCLVFGLLGTASVLYMIWYASKGATTWGGKGTKD